MSCSRAVEGSVYPVLGNNPYRYDYYFYEGWQIKNNAYRTPAAPDNWKDKAESIAYYQSYPSNPSRYFGVMPTTNDETANAAYDQEKFWYTWYAALLYSHEATGWGEWQYNGEGNYRAPYHVRPPIKTGGNYFFETKPTWFGDG